MCEITKTFSGSTSEYENFLCPLADFWHVVIKTYLSKLTKNHKQKSHPLPLSTWLPLRKIFFQYYVVMCSGQVKSPSFIFPLFSKILVSFYCQSVGIFMKINLCWIVFSFVALYGKTQVKEQENISIDFSTILLASEKISCVIWFDLQLKLILKGYSVQKFISQNQKPGDYFTWMVAVAVVDIMNQYFWPTIQFTEKWVWYEILSSSYWSISNQKQVASGQLQTNNAVHWE